MVHQRYNMSTIKIIDVTDSTKPIPKDALVIIPCKFHGSSRYEVLSILKNGNSSVYSYFLKYLKEPVIGNIHGRTLYVSGDIGQSNPIMFIFMSPTKHTDCPYSESVISALKNGLNDITDMIKTGGTEYPSIWIYNSGSAMYTIPWNIIRGQLDGMKINNVVVDHNDNVVEDNNDIMINAISIT
jgi:hypothetical protein